MDYFSERARWRVGNSSKPLYNPCPNCYVVTTTTEKHKNTLFHISMMLQIGGFYAYYLKGSVIPFITIKDCYNTLKNGLNSMVEVDKHIHNIVVIQKELERLKATVQKMEQLKKAYIQACFKYHPVE